MAKVLHKSTTTVSGFVVFIGLSHVFCLVMYLLHAPNTSSRTVRFGEVLTSLESVSVKVFLVLTGPGPLVVVDQSLIPPSTGS